MDTNVEKAFEFAQEVTKQLISLATAMIALTVTFLVDVLQGGEAGVWALKVGWLLFLISVPLGVAMLLSLSGNLERPHDGSKPSVYSINIRAFSMLQILTFVAGLGFTLVFGFKALR